MTNTKKRHVHPLSLLFLISLPTFFLSNCCLDVYAVNSGVPEDANCDGVVDIRDLALVGKAFGSQPGNQRWDVAADVDADGAVTIRDSARICLKFGTTICDTFGDLNKDGKIDIKDLAIVTAALGSFPGHPRWNSKADVNLDNEVNVVDMSLVAGHFGESCL